MRTALFFIAMSLYDCFCKNLPDEAGLILFMFLLGFLIMDIIELTIKK